MYDISSSVFENFTLASGVVVHNSKDISDAVCRVVYKVYEQSLKDAIQGNMLEPKLHAFPTVRSMQGAEYNDYSHSGEGSSLYSGGNSVFSSRPVFVQNNVDFSGTFIKKGR